MRTFFGILFVLLSHTAVCAELAPPETAAVQVVDQFVQGCFMNFPYPDKFGAWLAQSDFRKLSGADSSSYLAARPGDAWSAKLDKSTFIMTTTGDRACSVFANDLDGTMTKNLVTGFMDYLKTQGATYQLRDTTPKNAVAGYSTTNYAVSTGNQVIMNLSVTIAPRGTGAFQVALTASKVGN